MDVLVEGCSSASRGPMNYKPFPPYIREGRGSRVWDVDGNEYIDWQLSFGCLPMGHAHPKIVEVIQREVAGGSHFATALEVEVETAEQVVDAMDRAIENNIHISSTLGRHMNDNMVSFYMMTPGGFMLEFGYDGIQPDWDNYETTYSPAPSHWGLSLIHI